VRDEECVKCCESLERASLQGGGLIGWFCYPCETFYGVKDLTVDLCAYDEIRGDDN
jgi:hypothetical protein